MASRAEEGRGHAAISSGEPLPGRSGDFRMGQPLPRDGGRPFAPLWCEGRAPGELKHLSTPRKRDHSRSSGERTGNSPNPLCVQARRRCTAGVAGPCMRVGGTLAQSQSLCGRRTRLERLTVEGDSPVAQTPQPVCARLLSTTGHEEPGGKPGRPLPKAKYPADR